MPTQFWGDKRYYSLDYYLRQTYGEKLYKIALSSGCTCPNRDGTCGDRGCIFCSAGGSGDFAAPASLSVPKQLAAGRKLVEKKYRGAGVIAYFQSYTNTYAPAERLRELFTAAIRQPEVRILSIATRPDCLGEEVLDLLEELSREKPVWVELGLQTIHPRSADFIRRGYPLPVFGEAVSQLHRRGIPVIPHLILFLPGESREDMLESIDYLNDAPVQGVKLQLLHVLEGTDLADHYRAHPFYVPSMEEYFAVLGDCLCRLRPDIVVHRLTGDGPASLLIAPLWTRHKRLVLGSMQSYFRSHDIWQGKEYHK